MYEYGEENVVGRPRQAFPFAVVKLSYIPVSKPVDSKTQSEGSRCLFLNIITIFRFNCFSSVLLHMLAYHGFKPVRSNKRL